MKESDADNRSPFLSLIIPAYNEEKRIKNSLVAVQKYLDNHYHSVELIIVDDGSGDQTSIVAESCLNGKYEHQILKYDQNKGKGFAVKKGILNAKGKFVIFMDADLSTPIEELEPLIKSLEKGYDIAIGTRKNKEANVKKRQPVLRELLGKGFTFLTNVLLVKNISDITCGFKGFKREVAQDIFRRQIICNWSFDAEILFLAQKLKYTLIEVPVTWLDAEGTKVRLFRDIFGSLKGILQIRINHLFGHYKIGQGFFHYSRSK